MNGLARAVFYSAAVVFGWFAADLISALPKIAVPWWLPTPVVLVSGVGAGTVILRLGVQHTRHG